MITCAYCGVRNPDGARFCSWCGRELIAAPAEIEPGTAGYPPAESDPTQPVYPAGPGPYYRPPGPPAPPPAGPPPGEGPFAGAPRWFWPAAAGMLALGLLCVLGLLAVLLLNPLRGGEPAISIGGPSSTPTWVFPTAPPTLAPPTPFPSFTPQPPTQTALPPLPATRTPMPTLTSPGANTPIPGPAGPAPTPAWTRYLTPECAAALTRLRAASDGFSANPLSAFDSAWRAELGAAVGEARQQCGSLEQASPVPGQMAEAQRSLALASAEFDQSRLLLEEGTREWNPGKLWQGLQGLGRAAGHLNRALGAMAVNE